MAASGTPSKGKRIALWTVGILVGLVVVVIVGFNIYTRVTYSEFYAEATEEFEIPGIHAGFICQDLDHYDAADCWFFSGYTTGEGSDGSAAASPLYRRDADGTSVEFFAALPDGSPYTGHGSGITTSSEYAFLTCDDGYLVFHAEDLAHIGAGETVRAIDRVDLELTPAFLNIENGVLYAGTFHLLPDYAAPEHHHMVAPDGSENAGIMFAYPAVSSTTAEGAEAPEGAAAAEGAKASDSAGSAGSAEEAGRYGFASRATAAYSLPDRVQGVCVLPNGDIMLSTSYGFAASHLLTYRVSTENMFDAARAVAADPAEGADPDLAVCSSPAFFVDGRSVPLYFLDSTCLVDDLAAPPMTEGIEYHDGRVWISEESASNKYIFGKLYGAGDVFSLSVQTL